MSNQRSYARNNDIMKSGGMNRNGQSLDSIRYKDRIRYDSYMKSVGYEPSGLQEQAHA